MPRAFCSRIMMGRSMDLYTRCFYYPLAPLRSLFDPYNYQISDIRYQISEICYVEYCCALVGLVEIFVLMIVLHRKGSR